VDKAAYPDDLREYLESNDYRIDVNAKLGHDDDKTEFVEDAHETLDKRFEAFKHYVQEDDWDLFFGVFMTTDRVNHFLFKHYEQDGEYREEFFEFYRKVEWLEQEGWLEYAEDDHSELGDIAAETTAYSLIPGRFYINLEGREPRGSVPEDEYEATRDELKAALERLEGPDGNKVADRVVTKEDAFRGDHDDIAPDLVVIPNHGFDLKAGFKGGSDVFDVGPRNGMHSFDNATLFVDGDARIDDADLFDIAPTILELMDVEYDRADFDGHSLV
jgi:uncharacterized sulfatase